MRPKSCHHYAQWVDHDLSTSRLHCASFFSAGPGLVLALSRGSDAVREPYVYGQKIVHTDNVVERSPSGLTLRTIISRDHGAQTLYLGEQWLAPGQRVLLHTHKVEEILTFLSGTGTATLGDETITISPATSLFIPSGLPHGFQNTGRETLHLHVIFPDGEFARTELLEPLIDQSRLATPELPGFATGDVANTTRPESKENS